MAPPPAKRLKRMIVDSSDEDSKDIAFDRLTSQSSTSSTLDRRDNGSGMVVVPTGPVESLKQANLRPRNKVDATNSREQRITSKKSAQNSGLTKATSIYAFFNPRTHTQFDKTDTSENRIKIVTPEDDDDAIQDDLFDPIDLLTARSKQEETNNIDHKAHYSSAWKPAKSTGNALNSGSIVGRHKTVGTTYPISDSRTTSPHSTTENSIPWAEKYPPIDIHELAVHKKKIVDVHTWLESVLAGQRHQARNMTRPKPIMPTADSAQALLLIKGPPGSGKTATISLLAQALDVDIVEWKNPIGTEHSSESFISLATQFEDFLGRSERYSSLFLRSSRNPSGNLNELSTSSMQSRLGRGKVILVEDFPNTFGSGSPSIASFRLSVSRFLETTVSLQGGSSTKTQNAPSNITPVIMIISETLATSNAAISDSFTAHRLLGADILHHPALEVLEFNPVAPTYLNKALNLVLRKETSVSGKRRVPGPKVIAQLSEAGDIRNAIGALELMCIGAGIDGEWSGKSLASKEQKKCAPVSMAKTERISLATVSQRIATLDLFHAVGKVVYNKRDTTIASCPKAGQFQGAQTHDAKSQTNEVSVDKLLDETGTDTTTFIAALHENYVLSCSGMAFLEAANGCIDALSDSDLLASHQIDGTVYPFVPGHSNLRGSVAEALTHSNLCFHVAARGILFALPVPVNRRPLPPNKRPYGRDPFKMYYPTLMRLWKETEEVGGLVNKWIDTALGVSLSHNESAVSSRIGNLEVQETKLTTSNPIRTQVQASWSSATTKVEMILERLPYYTRIMHGQLNSVMLQELSKMIQFSANHSNTIDASSLDSFKDSLDTIFTTNNPGTDSSSVPNKDIEMDYNARSAFLNEIKLVLSDDDIEDD